MRKTLPVLLLWIVLLHALLFLLWAGREHHGFLQLLAPRDILSPDHPVLFSFFALIFLGVPAAAAISPGRPDGAWAAGAGVALATADPHLRCLRALRPRRRSDPARHGVSLRGFARHRIEDEASRHPDPPFGAVREVSAHGAVVAVVLGLLCLVNGGVEWLRARDAWIVTEESDVFLGVDWYFIGVLDWLRMGELFVLLGFLLLLPTMAIAAAYE